MSAGPARKEALVAPPVMTGDVATDHLRLRAAGVTQARSLGRLWSLARRSVGLVWAADRRLLLVTGSLQLLSGLVVAVQVLAIKAVLDAIVGGGAQDELLRRAVGPILLLAGVMAFSGISAAAQQQLMRLLGELVARRTRDQVLAVSRRVDLRSYDTPVFHDQLQRVLTNTVSRPLLLCTAVIGLVGGLAGSVAVSGVILSLHPVLLPLLLLSGVPMFLGTRRASRMEFAFAVAQVPRVRFRDYLIATQTGREEATEVRAYGLAESLRQRLDGVYDAFIADLRRHVARRTRLAVLTSVATSVVLTTTLVLLVWLVARGEVGLAEAGAALVAIRLLSSQLTTLFSGSQQIFESGLFLADLDAFLATTAEEPPLPGEPVPPHLRRLDVESATFTYPGSAEPAVRDVSLSIRAGQVVALVGENGSGKSTLAKLLAGLYQPDSGTVRWDGVVLDAASRAPFRDQTAVIFQDFVRFRLSARENIAFGRPGAPDEEARVVRAATLAGAHDFIERLPHGYDTVLSRTFAGGQEVSVGQWQRVALARAFYRDASFVILDEPSASLDPRAEHELFGDLRRMLQGRTVLYISHRMATVREADCIAVMDGGRIVESGTHEDLMALGGRYAELFTLQAGAYLEGPRQWPAPRAEPTRSAPTC